MLTTEPYNRHAPFLQSSAGQKLEEQLYAETIAEMGNYVTIPSKLTPEA